MLSEVFCFAKCEASEEVKLRLRRSEVSDKSDAQRLLVLQFFGKVIIYYFPEEIKGKLLVFVAAHRAFDVAVCCLFGGVLTLVVELFTLAEAYFKLCSAADKIYA